MDRIEKYKRVEEDQQQGKGKDKVISQERRDSRSDRYNYNKPRRDFAGQSGSMNPQSVNTVFKEPVAEQDDRKPEKRNYNLYCQYHQDHGHTTEDCRSLWDHLDQLVRDGKLKHLLYPSSGRGQTGPGPRRDDPPKPPLGTINVVFAVPGRTGSWPLKVMSVGRPPVGESGRGPKRTESGVPPLQGLGLKPQDLTPYDSPLLSFEGRPVVPKGRIRLPVQSGTEVVELDFIVVDAYSPYTALVGRPWIHALGAVPSTLTKRSNIRQKDRYARSEETSLLLVSAW
ncbi:uncharacterized protein LOC136065744 [Quercus suber]|uniref:uncharacterized protein LOC136065744 n=1 Tax=Quercus suber TaxID=58331 RepID=UPI0032E00514